MQLLLKSRRLHMLVLGRRLMRRRLVRWRLMRRRLMRWRLKQRLKQRLLKGLLRMRRCLPPWSGGSGGGGGMPSTVIGWRVSGWRSPTAQRRKATASSMSAPQ